MHSPHTANSHVIAVNPTYSAFLAILFLLVGTLLSAPAVAGPDQNEHPTLAVGSAAPDFCLPGVDGQTHCLQEYAASKVLVIAFICNHCPTVATLRNTNQADCRRLQRQGRRRSGHRAQQS